MGGPLNITASPLRVGLLAPIPAIPGPVCLIRLDEVLRLGGTTSGVSFSLGQLGIRSARMRANAGSAHNRLDRPRLARLNIAIKIVNLGQDEGLLCHPYL